MFRAGGEDAVLSCEVAQFPDLIHHDALHTKPLLPRASRPAGLRPQGPLSCENTRPQMCWGPAPAEFSGLGKLARSSFVMSRMIRDQVCH